MGSWKIKAKNLYREWRANLIVWAVQWIGGSAMISAFGHAFWREFHRAPLDWYLIGSLFLVGLILVVLGVWLQQRQRRGQPILGIRDSLSISRLESVPIEDSRFSPLQIQIIQLSRDLRQMLKDAGPAPCLRNTGPMPTGGDVNAWMRERMDESGLWTNAYSEWARKIIYRYQEEFAHRVKLVMTSLGKTTGMVVISLEPYTRDVRPGKDFQALIDLLLGFFVKLEIPGEERNASSYIARQDQETIKLFEDMTSEQMRVLLENPKMKSFLDQAYERKNKEIGKVENP